MQGRDNSQRRNFYKNSVIPLNIEILRIIELYERLCSRTKLSGPWKCKDSVFSLQQIWIMHGHQIFITEKYQRLVLEELYVGHPGLVKMKKALARSYYFWESIHFSFADFV